MYSLVTYNETFFSSSTIVVVSCDIQRVRFLMWSYTKHKYTRTGSLSGPKITFTENKHHKWLWLHFDILRERSIWSHSQNNNLHVNHVFFFVFVFFLLSAYESTSTTLYLLFYIHANYPLNAIFLLLTLYLSLFIWLCVLWSTNMGFLGICYFYLFFFSFQINAQNVVVNEFRSYWNLS